ncbi:TetM/TetW/TetO/TetS family tetracycline resistance ribosomal protection protein [uncultured Clostridium sp.]|jgi:small GTP-binding protein|uniref:GTP-binding protein n=1 Tax=uncultured Clostridium sp. TaxID=59620 RepID=UPI0026103826|nr:TetM/TetW/TetO/TetS family tetracycline resistance ribosomal protection protein [uncultured Clostridium sp.]
MKKTIGIFAHVDGGKTTFSESLLYNTNAIKNKGRVDHKDTFLDSHSIEKERGITIFSDIGIFDYKEDKYFLIDTPGHVDFSPEMERSISVLDYGILIISAVEKVQGHTITIWELLKKYNIPTFIFINKIDRTNADVEESLTSLKYELTQDIIYLESTALSDEAIEIIAEKDDELLELYLEGEFNETLWNQKLKELIKNREIFPVFKGAALLDEGIKEFFDAFHSLTYTTETIGDFKGRVFKIRYDEKGNRLTFIKALSGQIKTKDEIDIIINGTTVKEKINELRVYNGAKFKLSDSASCGDIFAVVGINTLKAGDSIGFDKKLNIITHPTLNVKVIYDEKLNPNEVFKIFRILESEDNSLNVIWNEDIKELSISIMGKVQLEVLEEILRDRFNLKVEFAPPRVLYKETIENAVIGYGHFEPLGHYSEVHLKLEEAPSGSGIIFENKCHADDMTTGNQNLIKTHIFEKEHKGVLTRSPITDMKITLLTGRAHNKHTSGGDFREATKRALRQGLEEATVKLLEPYYSFSITTTTDNLGRILADVQKLKGTFEAPENLNTDIIRIKGRGPVKTFMEYPLEFVSFTKGKGNLNLTFDSYDFCHNTQEVIEEIAYDKNADIEYTSTSIFCSKGQAYLVESDNAKAAMHCTIKDL